MRELARPGIAEIELCSRVKDKVQLAAGHQLPIVIDFVSGERTAFAVGQPTARRLLRGDTLIFDLSVRYRGYWSDTTNTLVIGAEPTDEQKKFFNAAKDAFQSAYEAMRPGTLACDVEKTVREAFSKHAVPVCHYSGHQVGTHVNDVPKFVPYDMTPLQEGMVFSLEIGTYAGEGGKTGARLEKVVILTQQGPEVLSRFKWGM